MTDDKEQRTEDGGQRTEDGGPPAAGGGHPDLCDAELVALLNAEPVLCLQLKAALQSNRWLVTIHHKVKVSPPDDISSTSVDKDFAAVDIADAMQGQCQAILRDKAAELQRAQLKAADSRNWR